MVKVILRREEKKISARLFHQPAEVTTHSQRGSTGKDADPGIAARKLFRNCKGVVAGGIVGNRDLQPGIPQGEEIFEAATEKTPAPADRNTDAHQRDGAQNLAPPAGRPGLVRTARNVLAVGMWILPGWTESWAAGLPRPTLRWLELHAMAGRPLMSSGEPPPLRVALVKTEVDDHLYAAPGDSGDLLELARSTFKMFGPLSLFTRFRADCLLVRLSDDPDCQQWRECFARDPDPADSERKRLARPFQLPPGYSGRAEPPVHTCCPVEEVDWSRYDAVFCHEMNVPFRIRRRFPNIFWSYWVGETGTPSYRRSLRGPLAGYHCFLTGGARRWRVRPSLPPHVLEFPYILQHPSDHKLLGGLSWESRRGILLEKQTSLRLPLSARRALESWGPVWDSPPEAVQRLSRLHQARYYLQVGGNPVWGNGLMEAAASGCLVLADPATLPNNASVLLPPCTVRDGAEAASKIDAWENQPDQLASLLQIQSEMAAWFLSVRPLGEWMRYYRRFISGNR